MTQRLLLICLSLSCLLSNGLYSQTQSTPLASQGTTTAPEYCKFLNTVAVHDGIMLPSTFYSLYSNYDTWYVWTSIVRYRSFEQHSFTFYYCVREGHYNDIINLSYLPPEVQKQFQYWERTHAELPTARILSDYFNKRLSALINNSTNPMAMDYSASAIRGRFSDTISSKIFNKCDHIVSLLFNNYDRKAPQYSFHVDFTTGTLNSSNTPANVSLSCSGTKILGFLPRQVLASSLRGPYRYYYPSAYVIDNADETPITSDLSLEFDSLDGSQSLIQEF